MMVLPREGWAGAMLCLVDMFLPAFRPVIGALPFADALRHGTWAQAMRTASMLPRPLVAFCAIGGQALTLLPLSG
jgi:hypothetical protein